MATCRQVAAAAAAAQHLGAPTTWWYEVTALERATALPG
jgi:hypothetical protein